MIKKSLITFLLLFITHLFITKLDLPHAAQHSFQMNSVKAQRFIYRPTEENIVIGSSLAERLIMDSLPDFYNLSFSGLGVFDGLHILSSHEKFPSNLLIEMNIIFRPESALFLSYINSPIINPIKKHIPSLRDRYQPVGILGETLISILNNSEQPNEELGSPAKSDTSAIMKMVSNKLENDTEVPTKEFLIERFIYLKREIKELEKEGVNIIFFEMPVNPMLCNVPRAEMVRDFFYRYFPKNHYQYIEIPDCNEYLTTDGLHLSYEEALKYSSYLREESIPLLQ